MLTEVLDVVFGKISLDYVSNVLHFLVLLQALVLVLVCRSIQITT